MTTSSAVRPRVIPVLLLKHGVIVRSQLFAVHQVIGNPMSTVERYSQWNADELVVLDIGQGEDHHDLRRDDLQQSYPGTSAIDVLLEIAKVCFMPLTFGGRIAAIADIEARLAAGADKVTVNTAAFDNPRFVEKAARRFGSQCIVASIDARAEAGGWQVFVSGGRRPTGLDPAEWAREMERRGAGEIFLNSIDRDGSGAGYDLALIGHVTAAVGIPVVACGGVGRYEHFAPAIRDAGAAAAAAANIFHFFELSYPHAKRACDEAGINVRPVRLGSRLLPREPEYDRDFEDRKIAERLRQAREEDYPAARPDAARRRRPIKGYIRVSQRA